jgi:acyl-coenzyme A synthetase/AMP-(fatty) acid ligase
MAPLLIGNYRTPTSLSEAISVSEFFTRYNPDEVEVDKVVLEDATFLRTITYGGLREQSASCAYGLRHRLGLKEQGTCLVMLPNCVCKGTDHFGRIAELTISKGGFCSSRAFNLVGGGGFRVILTRTKPKFVANEKI